MREAGYPNLDLGQNLAPIYVQLSTIFRRFIETGEWPIDRQIETHEKLAARFGVNPATVRKAIEILAREGLVVSSRRRGTFVIAKPLQEEWHRLATDWQAAIAADTEMAVECLSARRAASRPRPYHGTSTWAPAYQELCRLHHRHGRPVFLETIHLDRRIWDRLGADLRRGASVLFLVDRSESVTVSRAEQTIVFGMADGGTASLLRIALNAPVAIAHLSVFGAGSELICEVVSQFRGDCIRIDEALGPE